ncbi:hypothetical protein IscW_ISCW007869 [Ixodes scapularis]|uniref:Uncharacterized protein n=1 Tax=Ixodes scapularis TaxID=6945 RepID=B7PRJ3_IXOSC|nr:hypothetical protein IscW_ISCW007869 [Ixodes scapularis]|eukprot:XP_002399886.1 hypothetical protein IscW_ISCW007869 [Ixodes scapularis]
MSTISKNEGPASSAEGGTRLELVLLFAAAVIFLYMGILLALYTATPGKYFS